MDTFVVLHFGSSSSSSSSLWSDSSDDDSSATQRKKDKVTQKEAGKVFVLTSPKISQLDL